MKSYKRRNTIIYKQSGSDYQLSLLNIFGGCSQLLQDSAQNVV
jgi:hypothetical protein